jgi:hypothetical protein
MYPFSVRALLFRSFSFVVVMSCWYFAFWWGAIPLTLWYLWHYHAYELIFLGILIDIQFLPGTIVPYYTLGFIVLVTFSVFLKPMIRPHTYTYEIE